ncbi:hypothetical protein I551_4782 [Mycobacterium ulcerans str. Harvey]|uniref:Uncharacterized protein n=1 Tax=Mycobacterium ulcerans str. Harvey TaxID=1299332 RepID=A0ABN0QVM9_MYCUL|nr:hypothetical protein I551_4782 [Mycobacterium ulcerans str. Harvey]
MSVEQCRNRRRHLISGRGQRPVVGVAAAALATLIAEPMLAKSCTAAVTASGAATTNDITCSSHHR